MDTGRCHSRWRQSPPRVGNHRGGGSRTAGPGSEGVYWGCGLKENPPGLAVLNLAFGMYVSCSHPGVVTVDERDMYHACEGIISIPRLYVEQYVKALPHMCSLPVRLSIQIFAVITIFRTPASPLVCSTQFLDFLVPFALFTTRSIIFK